MTGRDNNGTLPVVTGASVVQLTTVRWPHADIRGQRIRPQRGTAPDRRTARTARRGMLASPRPRAHHRDGEAARGHQGRGRRRRGQAPARCWPSVWTRRASPSPPAIRTGSTAKTATTRPAKLGKPFTRWSIRKPADHLRRDLARPIRIGREAPRCLLARCGHRPDWGRAQEHPPGPPGRCPGPCDPGQSLRPQERAGVYAAGQRGTRSSCASHRRTRPGPTRSRHTSGRCGSPLSPTPTAPQPHRPDRQVASLSALAQPEPPPPPRRPGGTASRTRPHPRRRRAFAGADVPSSPQPDQARDPAVPGCGDQTAARLFAMTRSLPTPSGRRSPGSPVSVKPCRS